LVRIGFNLLLAIALPATYRVLETPRIPLIVAFKIAPASSIRTETATAAFPPLSQILYPQRRRLWQRKIDTDDPGADRRAFSVFRAVK